MKLDSRLLSDIKEYVDRLYIPEFETYSRAASKKEMKKGFSVEMLKSSVPRRLEDLDAQLEETFSQHLFRLIRVKQLSEVDIYKQAGIDRRLFSKIRSNDDYRPGRNTVISLSVALRLSLDECLDLLSRAGYTLSHSSRADLIIEYFIENERWDLFEINEALEEFGQPVLCRI